jgi:signal transduction histidine kinase
MKISIRVKITFMVIFFALFIIASSWFISKHVVNKVFVRSVKTNLVKTYDSCNNLFDSADEDFDVNDLTGNIDNPQDSIVVIFDSKNQSIYTTVNDESQMMRSIEGITQTINNNGDLVLKKGSYEITKNHDTLINADYYDLIGVLDNGMVIVVRSPIARIQTAMTVIIGVFNNIVLGLIIFSSVFVLALSSVFTAPIKRLSHAAKKMTELDFDVKIPVVTKDEIGELSSYMNAMSWKLQQTISELKAANVKLQKDIDNKQQIDDMRKEFLSHVSHELKTPIALIQGYAEGLKDMADDEESREFYTDVIIDEAKKMNIMVKKLLDLNEIEFGTEPLKIERFELVGFISQIISTSQILTDNSNANIEFSEEPPVYVWADEYMIEEVFTNLLTNAIHYVKTDGVIRIFLERKGDNVRVSVYNQGNQIADEDIDKLFIKFYKADKARTREYGGSGIGLSIVAATMEAHGKPYGVYNVEDGVVFYFELDANTPC